MEIEMRCIERSRNKKSAHIQTFNNRASTTLSHQQNRFMIFMKIPSKLDDGSLPTKLKKVPS